MGSSVSTPKTNSKKDDDVASVKDEPSVTAQHTGKIFSESNATNKTNCLGKTSCETNGGRKSENETQNGGKLKIEEDTESLDSKNSDDTIALAGRMESYLDEQNKDKGQSKSGDKSKNEEKTTKLEQASNDNIIETIAAENNVVLNTEFGEENPYEVDTIAYYIYKADWQAENEEVIKLKNGEVSENNCATKDIPEPNRDASADVDSNSSKADTNGITLDDTNTTETAKEDHIDQDPFEKYRKIYGTKRQSLRKPSLANKQALVLVKVGLQYKYVAVPAYLPGQKLYRTNAFAKGYVERAASLFKVKRPKGR